MLGGREDAPALSALDCGARHEARQQRVLGKVLESPAAARVADEVRRAPEQNVEPPGARLRADALALPSGQREIEGRSQREIRRHRPPPSPRSDVTRIGDAERPVGLLQGRNAEPRGTPGTKPADPTAPSGFGLPPTARRGRHGRATAFRPASWARASAGRAPRRPRRRRRRGRPRAPPAGASRRPRRRRARKRRRARPMTTCASSRRPMQSPPPWPTRGAAKPTPSADLAVPALPVGLAQFAAQDLAGGVARNGGDEIDRLRRLVAGDALARPGDDRRPRPAPRRASARPPPSPPRPRSRRARRSRRRRRRRDGRRSRSPPRPDRRSRRR